MKSSKKIVIPGTALESSSRAGKIGDFIIKDSRGLVPVLFGVVQQIRNTVDLIPYKNVYKPGKGDYVIGVVIGYAPNGWILDIGSYTKAFLSASEFISGRRFDPRRDELTKYLSIGEVVGVKISEVKRLGYFGVTLKSSPEDKDKKFGRIKNYYIIKVTTTKLPRIIGKKGSMIKLIKQRIKGDLIIAQNGVILFKGSYEDYLLLKKIINLIVAKTFASGLTDTVATMLGISLSKEGVRDKDNLVKDEENIEER